MKVATGEIDLNTVLMDTVVWLLEFGQAVGVGTVRVALLSN
jgi:hypothetical protein